MKHLSGDIQRKDTNKPSRALPCIALSISVMVLIGFGCRHATETEEKRISIAMPQWFYPSAKRPWLQKFWQTIREENPGWVFDLDLVPGKREQVLEKLMVVHASGQGPDLACVRLEAIPTLVEQGILVPIGDRLPAGVWEAMIPPLRPSVEWEGMRYVLPYDIGVRVILYREDLFHAAGIPEPSPTWTWDDLAAAARKLTRDLDGDGTIDQWGLGIPAARSRKSIFQWLPWFWSLGGSLQGKDGQVTLCTPAACGAMQWYRDLANKYRVTPATFYAIDQDAVFQGLAGGLFAITEGGSWEMAMLATHSPHHRKIRITLLPQPRPGAASTTLVDGWGFGILSQDREKQPVLAGILRHLCSTEHQLDKYRASGMLSPFQKVYQDPLFTQDSEGRMLAAALRQARAAPSIPSFPSISEALEIALQEVLMNGVRPAEALAEQDLRLQNRRKRH